MNKQIFGIHLGVYDYEIGFIITKDRQQVNKHIRYQLNHDSFDIDDFNRQGITTRGNLIYRKGYSPIIWLPRKPKTPREYATLAHELLHATIMVMDWADIPLTDASEEAYTHLLASLMNGFLTRAT